MSANEKPTVETSQPSARTSAAAQHPLLDDEDARARREPRADPALEDERVVADVVGVKRPRDAHRDRLDRTGPTDAAGLDAREELADRAHACAVGPWECPHAQAVPGA